MDSNSVEFLNGDPLDELKQACFLFHNNISGNARYFRSSSINDTTASIESNGKKADDNSEDEKQFVSKLDFTKPKEVLFPSKLINNLPQIPKISDAYSAQVHPQAIIPSHPIAPHYPILYSHVDASTHPHSISFLETKVRDLPRSSSTSRYPEQTHKSNRSQEERYQDYQYHSDDNYQKQQKVSQTDTRPKKDDVMKMFVPPMVRLMLSCLGDFKKLKINPDFKYLSAIGRCIFDRVYNEDLKEYLISFLELQLGHQNQNLILKNKNLALKCKILMNDLDKLCLSSKTKTNSKGVYIFDEIFDLIKKDFDDNWNSHILQRFKDLHSKLELKYDYYHGQSTSQLYQLINCQKMYNRSESKSGFDASYQHRMTNNASSITLKEFFNSKEVLAYIKKYSGNKANKYTKEENWQAWYEEIRAVY